VEREHSTETMRRFDLRRLWRDTSWTSGSAIAATLLVFAESILLARYLGAAVLGLFVLVRAYPEAVQQVLDCRTRETTVKYLGEYVTLSQRDRAAALVRLIWRVDVLAGLIAMAIVLATASVAARHIVHDATTTSLLAVYAVSQFVGTLDSASGSIIRVFERFRLASILGTCHSTVRFVGVLVVVLLGGRVAALVYMLVGVEVCYTLLATALALSILRRHIGFRIRGTTAAVRDRRTEILRFLLNTNIAGTLKMGAEKLLVVLVGALGGAPVAAQYKIATQAGSSIMLLSDPLYQVIYPTLSRLAAHGEWDTMFGGIKKLQRTVYLVALPVALAVTGLMVPLLPRIFGSGFKGALVPGILVLWGVMPNVLFFWRRPLLLSLGQSGRLTAYLTIALALELLLAGLLIQPLGALGAAIGIFAMWWAYAALEMLLVIRQRRMRIVT
jgi:O-antigen/teichoic acid export membrane protein